LDRCKENIMNVVVLVKQVPDTESLIEINATADDIKTDNLKWIMNPYDELAVEEAIRIKEKQGNGKVTVLSVGAERVVAAIRTALAMGADEGLLISDPAQGKTDAILTAKVLAAALKTVPFDLIIAGQRAVDDDNYSVPSAVAEYLGIPMIGMVVHQEINAGKILCEHSLQDGTAVVEADLPALLTTQRGLNQPRYASLPNIMKAKKKPLETKNLSAVGLTAADFDQPALKTKVLSLAFPPHLKVCKMITGETIQEKATNLVRALREEAGVL
jgi:electron transfer flavoprotein beta subunit